MSRLFSPYGTVGDISSGRPFYLIPNQNSASAMMVIPIGDRFQILSCERLQPLLVSQKVPTGPQNATGRQHISHVVSDATLSISVVAHGPRHHPRHVTLFRRAQAVHTMEVIRRRRQTKHIKQRRDEWKVVDLLHLGLIKVPLMMENKGKVENAAIVAAILSDVNDAVRKGEEGDSDVVVAGDSEDDDSDASSSSVENTKSGSLGCHCQVVVLLATRYSVCVHKRIAVESAGFIPSVGLHPSAYVNKIILGGRASATSVFMGEDAQSPALLLLNIQSGAVIHVFRSVSSMRKDASTCVTALAQSPVMDTVAVGTTDGMVHMINLKKDKTLFSLDHRRRGDVTSSNKERPLITSLSFRTDGIAVNLGIAPIAVGRSDGCITVWNLNPPKIYKKDNGNAPKLVPQIITELFRVHGDGGVAQVMYLPQEPLLLSLGRKSNAVFLHIFDKPDHSGRILRQLKGHSDPPYLIRYLHPGASAGDGIIVNMAGGANAAACQILSAGLDLTLRVFSTAKMGQDREYSQATGLEKKVEKLGLPDDTTLLLPPVIGMATCDARNRDWGNIVTIHKDHAGAYMWSSKRGAEWGPALRQPTWNVSSMAGPLCSLTHAAACAMSACGNFALVGTKGGIIYKYNVQSGKARGSFPRGSCAEQEQNQPPIPGNIKRAMKAMDSNRPRGVGPRAVNAVHEEGGERDRQGKLKHSCHTGYAVTGISVDSTNKTMVSVGSDAKLILWRFSTHSPHREGPHKLPSPATMLRHNSDSDLVAIALEDYTTVLFDCTTLSVVRRFGASGARHLGPLADLAFDPDGRTLFTASLDASLLVWDIPTNRCVDWLGFETPPTSLTVSPTGEFLATAHFGKLGLSIWRDRRFYQKVNLNGAELRGPFWMEEPQKLLEVSEKRRTNISEDKVTALTPPPPATDEMNKRGVTVSKLPHTGKEGALVTLSGLPASRWQCLFSLDLIRERNTPQEPSKRSPIAPFFLQWGGRIGAAGEGAADKTSRRAIMPEDCPDAWKGAWCDDDYNYSDALDEGTAKDEFESEDEMDKERTKRRLKPPLGERILDAAVRKRRKISLSRSRLASLLNFCSDKAHELESMRFQEVTDHIETLGPSAIDFSLSSLCKGMHDLEEGIPLLIRACLWLIEACESREGYEAINACLHRFLNLHATLLAGIRERAWIESPDYLYETASPELDIQTGRQRREESIKELIEILARLHDAQQIAAETVNGKLQMSLCLVRHFSRMV